MLVEKTISNNDIQIVIAIKIDNHNFCAGGVGIQRGAKMQLPPGAQPDIQKRSAVLDQVRYGVPIKVGISPARGDARWGGLTIRCSRSRTAGCKDCEQQKEDCSGEAKWSQFQHTPEASFYAYSSFHTGRILPR